MTPEQDITIEPEYTELASLIGWPDSKYLPWIFKLALEPSQARIALGLNISTEEIAELLNISAEEVEEDVREKQAAAIALKLAADKETVDEEIQYMFELGYVFPTRKGWRWARDIMQMRDSQTNTKYDQQLGNEYFDLWKAFERAEMYAGLSPVKEGTAKAPEQLYRVIPAMAALSGRTDVIPEENYEEILKKAAVIAVVHCPCKRIVRDRDPEMPLEVCIICDRVAEHNIRRGTARVISLEEALEIHATATEAGLVCMPQSTEAWPKAVCHCHRSCCGILTPAELLNYPATVQVAPSKYRASTDEAICTGCGNCLEVCQFGALEMKRSNNSDAVSLVDMDRCLGCGLCVTVCSSGARTMTSD